MLKILNDFREELQTYSEQLELHNEMETVLRQDMLDCAKLPKSGNRGTVIRASCIRNDRRQCLQSKTNRISSLEAW
jgi:Ni,Fe-hydrogenase III large subunit